MRTAVNCGAALAQTFAEVPSKILPAEAPTSCRLVNFAMRLNFVYQIQIEP